MIKFKIKKLDERRIFFEILEGDVDIQFLKEMSLNIRHQIIRPIRKRGWLGTG